MNLSTEAKVGSVTLLGLLLLAYMIVHLTGFSFTDKGYPIQAVFSQVSGLKPGNAVRYAGVEIGRVKEVTAQSDGVHVTIMINPGVKIPEGAKFSIGTEGFMGERFVDIAPPRDSSGFLPPNSVVRGEDQQGMDQLIATANQVLLDAQKLINSMNDIIGDDQVKAAIKDTALSAKAITANLNILSASLARMAENNEGDVNMMVRNLRDMSASLRTVAARVDNMMAVADNDGQTARDLREAIQNLKTTSVRVEKMAASLEGVVTDPETSKNVKETLKNAREVSEKANKMLNKVQSVSAQTGFEVLYNTDSRKYRTNADVKINTSPQDFAVIGVSNIGDGSRTNFQVGKGTEQFDGRAGVIEGKAGVGLDAKLGSQLKLSLDVYDPNDVRVKLRSQYQIAPDTFIVGETDSLNKQSEKNTYVGIRRAF